MGDESLEKELPYGCSGRIGWEDELRGAVNCWIDERPVLDQINYETALIRAHMNKTGVGYKTAIQQLQESGKVFGRRRKEVKIPSFIGGPYGSFKENKSVSLCKLVAEKVAGTFEKEVIKPAKIIVLMTPEDADHVHYVYEGRGGVLVAGFLNEKLTNSEYEVFSIRTFGSGTIRRDEQSGLVIRMAYKLRF